MDQHELQEANITHKLWVTKSQESIFVEDMATEHIRRCINMIETGRFDQEWSELYAKPWWEIFENELMARGEY